MINSGTPNKAVVRSKNASGQETTLTFNLADDDKEVRGFGQLITAQTAKELAKNYFDDCVSVLNLIKKIEDDEKGLYKDLAGPELETLRKMMDAKNQTVSGVFGKEIILQILSQRNCEGIRYVVGSDQGLNTIILLGVEQDENKIVQGTAVSMPLKQQAYSKTNASDDDPANAEVHKNSLTIAKVNEMMAIKSLQSQRKPENIIFGAY